MIAYKLIYTLIKLAKDPNINAKMDDKPDDKPEKIKTVTIGKKRHNTKKTIEIKYTNENLYFITKKIGCFRNLKCLNLSNNYIKNFPSEIGQLINLEKLYLENNLIGTIPKEIGKLINLQILNLSNNKIQIIPKKIGELINLLDLDLNKNEIQIIPKKISELINLWHLNLNKNKIQIIPKEIGKLISLKTLNLNYNYDIKILPNEIKNLVCIQHLNIEHTNINIDNLKCISNIYSLIDFNLPKKYPSRQLNIKQKVNIFDHNRMVKNEVYTLLLIRKYNPYSLISTYNFPKDLMNELIKIIMERIIKSDTQI